MHVLTLRFPNLVLLLFLTAMAGCSAPEKATDLQARVKASLDAAQQAQSNKDAKAARAAATVATEARDKLKVLAGRADGGDEQTAAAGALAAADQQVFDANQWAQLAEEEQRHSELLQGLRAKAYRTSRQSAYSATLEGLAFACEQAAKYPSEKVPEKLRPAVEAGVDLATSFGAQRVKDGEKPDLIVTAQELRKLVSTPPSALSPALVFVFCLGGYSRLALLEYDSFTAEEFKQSDDGRMLRCFLYRSHGFDRLADHELTEVSKVLEGSTAERKETEAMFYLALAFLALKDNRVKEGDRFLALAFRASPNNLVAVFLTGERLAADGKPEAAAESLETLAGKLHAVPHKALAGALKERARQMRDAKGPPEGFLADPVVIWSIVRLALYEAAKTMPEAKIAHDKLEAAVGLADRMRIMLP